MRSGKENRHARNDCDHPHRVVAARDGQWVYPRKLHLYPVGHRDRTLPGAIDQRPAGLTRAYTAEATKPTEKIHNEGTKSTKTNEAKMRRGIHPENMWIPRRIFSSFDLRSLRFFAVNLLRSIRTLRRGTAT